MEIVQITKTFLGTKIIQEMNYALGTIHSRRRQIFTIFDPYPPTIGIPAKCL